MFRNPSGFDKFLTNYLLYWSVFWATNVTIDLCDILHWSLDIKIPHSKVPSQVTKKKDADQILQLGSSDVLRIQFWPIVRSNSGEIEVLLSL